MSAIVTMSSTVGQLVNGTTYRVRSKTAEELVRLSKATVVNTRKPAAHDNAGKG